MRVLIHVHGPRRRHTWHLLFGITYRFFPGYPPHERYDIHLVGMPKSHLVGIHLLLVAIGIEFETTIPKPLQ